MALRITQNQIANRFQSDVQQVYSRMFDTQRQLSSGTRVEKPSDDPFGASQIIGFDAQLSDINQFSRNVENTMGFLDTADSALDAMGTAMKRIRDLVIKASNGTNDQNALNSIAAEITQLKEAVRDNVNSRFGSQHIFGGTAVDQAPYPNPGNAYAGNGVSMNRRVSPGLTIAINTSGPAVLGATTGALPGQMSTLDLIDQIVADIQTGSPASLNQLRGADLAALDARFEQVLQVRTELGSKAARLEITREQLLDLETRLTSARSQVADVDFAKATIDFQSQQNMYQAALASGTRMLGTTILDFI